MTQLLSQLSGLEWAEEVLQLPQCAQVTNDHGLVKQRGPRVKACIHWASAEENLWVENAAGTSQFSGPARQISYSLAKAAMGGQVLMTEAASREQLGRSEDSDFTYMRPLGYYETGPSVVLITQLEPPTWDFGKAGFSTPGFVNGLNWVREPPRSLVGPPGLKPIPELEPSNGDSNTGNAGVVQLSLVTMSFPTLKGKVPKRMADTISALLEGLAQTYCGYVTPLEVSSLDSRQVLFMSALNSVSALDLASRPWIADGACICVLRHVSCLLLSSYSAIMYVYWKTLFIGHCLPFLFWMQVRFCAGLQVALVHVPWEIEDEIFCGDEQLTVNGKPIFRGPRVAMVIASLPAGSFKWHSVAERTKSRRPLTAIEVQFQAPEVADSGNSVSFACCLKPIILACLWRALVFPSSVWLL